MFNGQFSIVGTEPLLPGYLTSTIKGGRYALLKDNTAVA